VAACSSFRDSSAVPNGDDYFFIDSNVQQSGNVFGFHNGDFDYNGEINGDDYFIIDSNILSAQGSAPMGSASLAADFGELSRAVPEPAGIVSLLLASLALPRRFRRG